MYREIQVSSEVMDSELFLSMSLDSQIMYYHMCLDSVPKGFVAKRDLPSWPNTEERLEELEKNGYIAKKEEDDEQVYTITDWNKHSALLIRSKQEFEYDILSLNW